jgi:hypothetical protein
VASGVIEWGVASRARREDIVSGDGYLVHEMESAAFVAVIDGRGHGEAAAAVTRAAITALRAAAIQPLPVALRRCHDLLRESRGAAASIARIDLTARNVALVSVGNVYNILIQARDGALDRRHAPRHAGIVGRDLPAIQPSVYPLQSGDLLLCATDGLDPDFMGSVTSPVGRRLFREAPLRDLAEYVLAGHHHGGDDGLVLAVRYHESQ